jgi:hypothetical protein
VFRLKTNLNTSVWKGPDEFAQDPMRLVELSYVKHAQLRQFLSSHDINLGTFEQLEFIEQ